LVSSVGRLFDAAAAVLGVRHTSDYEGQAAMELEALAENHDSDALPFPSTVTGGTIVLDPLPLLHALGAGVAAGISVAQLAAAFHESVAAATVTTALRLCRDEKLETVALGGGVFQNARLLARTRSLLEEHGLRVLVPVQLSPNDGSVSYGQAAVAAARLAREADLCA
jgi:hydrogenase maturation protein HypF